MDSHTINQISIPLFTGAIGYVINWTGEEVIRIA